MDREKKVIYKRVIGLLAFLEIVINDEKSYKTIRKQMLDLANDIIRLGVANGD